MGNGITQRQNEDKYITYLAAQKQLYTEVKRLNNVGILFSVVLPVFFAAFQIIVSDDTYLNAASYLFSIAGMIVSLTLETYMTQKKETAAKIQQLFDVYVYQMPWDDRLFGVRRDLTYIVAEKSHLLLRKAGQRERLVNWYTPEAGNVDLLKGIFMCQKENYYWDVGLRKKFRSASCAVIVFLTVIIFSIGIVRDESVAMLLWRFAFVLPMLQWLFETVRQLNADIGNLAGLDELITSPSAKDMDDLQLIQSRIYMHRKSCLVIPDKFYQMFKNNDEDAAYRTSLMDG